MNGCCGVVRIMCYVEMWRCDMCSPTFFDDFKKHVGFLDVFFDNVGGDILNFALTRLNKGARIALCGAISDYSAYLHSLPPSLAPYLAGSVVRFPLFLTAILSSLDAEKPKGLSAYMNLISQRATLQGFIV